MAPKKKRRIKKKKGGSSNETSFEKKEERSTRPAPTREEEKGSFTLRPWGKEKRLPKKKGFILVEKISERSYMVGFKKYLSS